MRLLEALEHDVARCKKTMRHRMATEGARFLKGNLKISSKLHALLSCAGVTQIDGMEFEESSNLGFSILLDFYAMDSDIIYSTHYAYSIDTIKNWITLQV